MGFYFGDCVKYKSVIFDCYGTLFIFEDLKRGWNNWIQSFYSLLNETGNNISLDELKKELDGFMSLPAPTNRENNFTLYEQRINNKLHGMEIFLSENQIRNLAEKTIEGWHDEVSLAPETFNTLTELKKITRLILLSNFDHPPQIYKLIRDNNLLNMFEHIIISGEVGAAKPDPLIFSIALEKLNLRKEDVIYIGDSEEDFLGSRNSGIDFVLINRDINSTSKLSADYKEDESQIEKDWTQKYSDWIKRISSLSEIFSILN